MTGRPLRAGFLEPGAVSTELASHNRPEVLESIQARFGSIDRLESEDIARSIESSMVTQPRHVAVNQILIRPYCSVSPEIGSRAALRTRWLVSQ